MKKLTSIRTNLFLAMVLIVLIMSAVFLPYGFYSNIKSVRNSVDERLKAAAESLAEIMPNGFQKRLESGKAGMEETGELRKKISRLKNSSSLTSLYAIYKNPDGKIRYLADEIFLPNREMENPNPRILSAFENRKPAVAQIKDDTFDFMARTAIIPMESDDGSFFVGVAELETANIRPIIFNSLLNFFILLSLGSFLALIAAASVARKFSRPMRRLSSFTQKLTDSNFDKSLKLSDTLPESEVRSSEVKTLSGNIDAMRAKLYEYIENLKLETQARNRAETELKIAGQIQHTFLPQKDFKAKNIEISVNMQSAREAGGDFFCIEKLDGEKTAFAIGDVSGKGVPAALFMARITTLVRAALRNGAGIAETVDFLNQSIAENNESCTFVTFFLAVFDAAKSELNFVNCGHNPPIIKTANAPFKILEVKPNTILGVFAEAKFETQKLKVQSGDILFLYTDGITEAANKNGELLGCGRLLNILNGQADISAKNLVSSAILNATAFEEDLPQTDDITSLAAVFK